MWLVGVLYRPNSELFADIYILSNNLEDIMDMIQNENTYGLIMGNMNVDLLKFEAHRRTDDYLKNKTFFTRISTSHIKTYSCD